ncbi:hypothetical protein [Campylobacter sp. CCUG 57310]|uniref:hypothetical protein n=1 Tax=Campylobacter TaxID=194 RepID=UPI00156476BC|nr:hypothetical protein [Campylobacter sp. CCUG 57310]QKF91385.1 hypothetical protein CORI_0149 [Campylobacter sp. CCUG 57310]
MDFLFDMAKIFIGALLTIIGQLVYFYATNKRENKKIKIQKLEEMFLIIGDMVGNSIKYTSALTNPNLESQIPKNETGKLHLLISVYAPELKKDYEEFMKLFQKITNYAINQSNSEIIAEAHIAFVLKGNEIKEKIAKTLRRTI